MKDQKNRSAVRMNVINESGNINVSLSLSGGGDKIKLSYSKTFEFEKAEFYTKWFDVSDRTTIDRYSTILEMLEELEYFDLDKLSSEHIIKLLTEWFFTEYTDL